ncbi:hypothetical protein DFH06DRAFT_1440259, partial [Mycena polygramma]
IRTSPRIRCPFGVSLSRQGSPCTKPSLLSSCPSPIVSATPFLPDFHPFSIHSLLAAPILLAMVAALAAILAGRRRWSPSTNPPQDVVDLNFKTSRFLNASSPVLLPSLDPSCIPPGCRRPSFSPPSPSLLAAAGRCRCILFKMWLTSRGLKTIKTSSLLNASS